MLYMKLLTALKTHIVLAFGPLWRGGAWAGAVAMGLAGLWLAPSALAQRPPSIAGQPQLNLPRIQLQAGMHLIDAQVASLPAQRNTGLMWRQSMPTNEGMLFVFEQPAVQCFWMQNTFIALTAAFVADDGTIVNLADMQPLSTQSHCSTAPVRYVLEMHQGWFAQRGLQAGSRLRAPGGQVFSR
jgi:uncharacterized membrane protein (UPF0127 family)